LTRSFSAGKIDPSISRIWTRSSPPTSGRKPTREILDAVREKMDRKRAFPMPRKLKHEIKSHIIRILKAPSGRIVQRQRHCHVAEMAAVRA